MHLKIVKAWTAASIFMLTMGGCTQMQALSQKISTGQSATKTIKPLADIKATVHPKLLWKQQIEGTSTHYKVQLKAIENTLFGASNSTITAWDKNTGKLLWKETPGESITGGIQGDDNTIYIGTDQGSALALDPKTGSTRWIALLDSPILSISNSKDKHIAFRTLNGKIHLLSTETGEVSWQRSHKPPLLSLQGASSPILAGSLVITGMDNGTIYAYSTETAQEMWSVNLSTLNKQTVTSGLVDIDAEMKTLGTVLFATGYNGHIAGIDMRTGKIGWKKELSSHSGIDTNQNHLFVSDDEGNLYKLSALTGVVAWKNNDFTNRAITAPTLYNTSLIIGDTQGYLHWIDTATGKATGRIQTGKNAIKLSPVINGTTVYTINNRGQISAYTTQ